MPVAKNHVPRNRVVLIRLTEKDFRKLKEKAERKRMGVGPFIRMMAFEALEKEES